MGGTGFFHAVGIEPEGHAAFHGQFIIGPRFEGVGDLSDREQSEDQSVAHRMKSGTVEAQGGEAFHFSGEFVHAFICCGIGWLIR